MAGFGRCILSADTRNLLSRRSCLLKISQSFRQSTIKQTEQVDLPTKPKRPQPSFLLFLQSIRPKLMEENPDMKAMEVVRKASTDWNNMDPAVKETYKNQYSQKYEEYLENLKQYKESLTDQQKELLAEQKKKSKEKTDAMNIKRKMDLFQKPKKPQNAFLLFLDSKRKIDNPRENLKSWVCDTTEKWKKMSNEQKERFYSESSKLMEQYKEDLIKWEQNMINLGHPDIVRRSSLQKAKVEEES
ncbi:mitochondrial transcription factor A [Halictus rubicundus]|uniref:mitochondrial transcription factor A n=1 Tax=Halictus rubicundus TaxID=77578 RepID=UPI0040368078